jgi:hypothetical protein
MLSRWHPTISSYKSCLVKIMRVTRNGLAIHRLSTHKLSTSSGGPAANGAIMRPDMRRIAERPPAFLKRGSAFDERFFNDEMAGLAVAAFEEATRFEGLAQFFEHARAAAHHDAVGLDVERRLTDIVEQLP